MTADLAAFVLAQLDADEAVARAATQGEWEAGSLFGHWWTVWSEEAPETGVADSVPCQPDAAHIALHDPAFELDRIAWLRAVVEDAVDCMAPDRAESDPTCDGFAHFALLALAQPYRSRPGWRDEWTVGA